MPSGNFSGSSFRDSFRSSIQIFCECPQGLLLGIHSGVFFFWGWNERDFREFPHELLLAIPPGVSSEYFNGSFVREYLQKFPLGIPPGDTLNSVFHDGCVSQKKSLSNFEKSCKKNQRVFFYTICPTQITKIA